jgi:aryl-alcohol dehydrogenase-like predicted oxidoreductase
MRRRPLGKTGLEVPELCLGTWGLSGDAYGPVEEAEQDLVIERALALGVTAFETADAYAQGAMESRLGRLLEKHPDAIVITKVGTDRSSSPPQKRFDVDYLREAVAKSRERLKRPIDVLLLHNPSSVPLGRPATRELMQQLQTDGVIKAWGVSVGNAEIGRAAIEAGAQVLQIAYSAFYQRELNDLLGTIRDNQLGVLVRSVLSHGLLCGQWPSTKTFASGDHRRDRWTNDDFKKRISQLSALRPVVAGSITSLRAAALRFVLDEPLVSAAVIGPKSTLQLDQLLRDAGKEPPYLPQNARMALMNRLAGVGIKG